MRYSDDATQAAGRHGRGGDHFRRHGTCGTAAGHVRRLGAAGWRTLAGTGLPAAADCRPGPIGARAATWPARMVLAAAGQPPHRQPGVRPAHEDRLRAHRGRPRFLHAPPDQPGRRAGQDRAVVPGQPPSRWPADRSGCTVHAAAAPTAERLRSSTGSTREPCSDRAGPGRSGPSLVQVRGRSALAPGATGHDAGHPSGGRSCISIRRPAPAIGKHPGARWPDGRGHRAEPSGRFLYVGPRPL